VAAAVGSLLLGAGSAAAANVLVVGDSLAVGTAPYLKRELRGTPLTVDAVVGRPSPSGVPVLAERLRPEHDVVVFDLGTNDGPSQPGALATSLARARQLVGDRCLVIATISRPPVHGVTVAAQNDVVESFAATGGAQVVDWRAAAGSEPGLIQRDGVHGTATGYALRGALFAQAVGACLSGGVTGIPAPRGDGKPPPVAKSHKPRAPRRPPAQVDWSAVAAWGPIDLTRTVAVSVVASLTIAIDIVRTAFAGSAPEPVLGGPEG
jgi:lysophospholipase L1-like esterase